MVTLDGVILDYGGLWVHSSATLGQEPGVPVDFVVDDDSSVVEAHGGYRIKPFDGDPWDEELLKAVEALDA